MGDWDELPGFGDEEEDEQGTAVVGLGSMRPGAPETQRPFLIFLSGDQSGRMIALEDELIIGRASDASVRIIGDGVSRRHARIFERHGVALIEDLGSTNGTFVNQRKISTAVTLSDGDKIQLGGTLLLKFSLQDELDAQIQRDLYDAALKDALTKAHNRRALLEYLDTELAHASRYGNDLSLALFDLDHFKQLNDTYGHLAGDEVLRRFAGLVIEMTRKSDFFARYGGEEFALVCRETDVVNTVALANRIRQRVAAHPFAYEGARIQVTVSIGVSAMGEDATPETLIALADEALYAAKRAGRDRVVARSSS